MMLGKKVATNRAAACPFKGVKNGRRTLPYVRRYQFVAKLVLEALGEATKGENVGNNVQI